MNNSPLSKRLSWLLHTAAIAALGLTLIEPSTASAAPVVEIELHTEMGGTDPLTESGPLLVSALAGTEYVRVVMQPPAGGELMVTYSSEGTWELRSDGSWSALMPVAGIAETWYIAVDLEQEEYYDSGMVTLTTSAVEENSLLTITTQPEATWIDDIVESFCPPSCCADVLSAPSLIGVNKGLWQWCKEQAGL